MKKLDKGDKGTFYMHGIRHYTPIHAQDTWKKDKLGVTIFAMEGF